MVIAPSYLVFSHNLLFMWCIIDNGQKEVWFSKISFHNNLIMKLLNPIIEVIIPKFLYSYSLCKDGSIFIGIEVYYVQKTDLQGAKGARDKMVQL